VADLDLHPADWKERTGSVGRALRRRALLATALGAVVVLALAGSVYTIVLAARSSTADSQELSVTDEALRAATVTRAQLAVATLVVGVTAGRETASGATLRNSLLEARTALAQLEVAEGAIDSEELVVASAALRERATGELATLDAGRLPTRGEAEALERSFREVAALADAHRDELRRGLEATTDRLGSFGRLSGFVIAFVIPALALFAYRGFTKAPRDTIAFAHAADEADRRSRNRAVAVGAAVAHAAEEVEAIRRALAEPAGAAATGDPHALVDRLKTRLQMLGTLSGMAGGGLVRHRLAVDLAAEAHSVAGTVPADRSVTVSGTCEPAWADPAQVGLLIRALVDNAVQHGAGPIEVELDGDGTSSRVAVSEKGPGLPFEVERVLFADRSPFTAAGAEHALRGIGLLVAQLVVEDSGGTLTYVRKSGRTRITASLPVASDRSRLTRTPARVAATT
jgi:Histidine kinase-, DNA gyrase B-, and HSP90-like ATPase